MKEKSALLNALLKECSRHSGNNVTINTFFSEIFKYLNEGSAPVRTDTDSGVLQERNALCELFEAQDIDVFAAYEKLKQSFDTDRETILDSLALSGTIMQLAIEDTGEDEITTVAVCKLILASPSPQIKACIEGIRKPCDSAAENSDTPQYMPEEPHEEQEDFLASLEEQREAAMEALHKRLGSLTEEEEQSLSESEEQDKEEEIEEESEKKSKVDSEEQTGEEESEEDLCQTILDILSGTQKEEEFEEEPEEEQTVTDIMDRVGKVHSLLSETVFGQDHAIATFVSGFFQSELIADVFPDRNKPRATFLFAGPPGVGKTYLSEQAAKALGLPFRRFDMSEYSAGESNIEFCGSNRVYRNGREGNVTGFVFKFPKCVLLFDEIEKAHLNVIHLFLQVLDAGRLRDNYTEEEVSFTDAIIIFTTNAGRRMYEDESINLVTASKKTIIKALSSELNPLTKTPVFPPAICSRFASGNIVMFNRLGADYLLRICERELGKQCKAITEKTGIKITYDKALPYAILFGEGGRADARTVTAKSEKFIHSELYELLRLMKSHKNSFDLANLKSVGIMLSKPEKPAISSLFAEGQNGSVLVFANKTKCNVCASKISSVKVFTADSQDAAKQILESQDITLILCDLSYKVRSKDKLLNSVDVASAGMDFFGYITAYSDIPVYLLDTHGGSYSSEELESLASLGARGLVDLSWKNEKIDTFISEKAKAAFLRKAMSDLARANKILSFKTAQKADKEGVRAVISLYDFKLSTAIDAEDNDGILNDVSKPKVRFSDVIGAKDAKDELSYFIRYLKDPVKYVKRGVKTPKGILLYGPPGTGKTLIAKAMAGESDVTFIRAEGNQFLKRFVGQGPESVHQLFATARKYAPSILFIDEVDAIARNRQSATDSDVSGDVLTSFLTEMDGFNTDNDRPVFVLAATNFNVEQSGLRSLDPAFLRRFDRRIFVDLPNRDERTQYINLRLSKIKGQAISKELIENLAVRSTGASLAELDSVFELALRNVIKTDECVLTDNILEDAFEQFNSGEVKRWSEEELIRTARHEAGHALISWAAGDKPSYLTVVARGSHGGYMQRGDTESKGLYTKQDLLNRVRAALAGRAAEVVYYGSEGGLSSGASGDLQSATDIVGAMICKYGMDEEAGLCSVNASEVASSPFYSQILARINQRLKEEFAYTVAVVRRNRAAIDCLVEKLLQKNSLKADEIDKIIKAHFVAEE